MREIRKIMSVSITKEGIGNDLRINRFGLLFLKFQKVLRNRYQRTETSRSVILVYHNLNKMERCIRRKTGGGLYGTESSQNGEI